MWHGIFDATKTTCISLHLKPIAPDVTQDMAIIIMLHALSAAEKNAANVKIQGFCTT